MLGVNKCVDTVNIVSRITSSKRDPQKVIQRFRAEATVVNNDNQRPSFK